MAKEPNFPIDRRDVGLYKPKEIIVNGINFGLDKTKQLVLQQTLSTVNYDPPNEASMLGTPVYDNIVLGKLDGNLFLDITGETDAYSGFKINQVLIEVSGTNNVVTQPIQGRNGTIKQYISQGDLSILIRGTISGRYNPSTNKWESAKKLGVNYHPKEELRRLINICKVGNSIPVTSDFLNDIMGVDDIVITDFNMPQTEGGRYSQVFEISALSDRENILDFTEEEVNDTEQLRNILGLV